MTKIEAMNLAAQLNIVLPKTKCADVLLVKCIELGYLIGYESPSADWIVFDMNNNEIARCA